MTTPFIGEIRMFAGTFAPQGWAFCDGQLINVRDNEALFSVIGSVYGGDGRTTFGLPDMRGRLPIHAGSGLGLTPRAIGARGGSETVSVTESQLPQHTHALQGTSDLADRQAPANSVPARGVANLWSEDFDSDPMSTQAITSIGGGGSHNNLMPFAVINFIIATTGLIPTQT
ncbi:MAG: tail fiber protein [Kiloniellales bacterium]|nr:tail fiber protein [Kiloniellales bacterium]